MQTTSSTGPCHANAHRAWGNPQNSAIRFQPRYIPQAQPAQQPIETAAKVQKTAQAFLDEWLPEPVPQKSSYTVDFRTRDVYMLGTYDKFVGASESVTNQLKSHGYDKRYNFLSNFDSTHPVTIEGETFKSIEHFYQSRKVLDNPEVYAMVCETKSSGYARKLAREHGTSLDEATKIKTMKIALTYKFMNEDGSPTLYGEKLLQTGNSKLIEGNRRHFKGYGDDCWGAIFTANYKSLEGQNLLGKFLENVRAQLQSNIER